MSFSLDVSPAIVIFRKNYEVTDKNIDLSPPKNIRWRLKLLTAERNQACPFLDAGIYDKSITSVYDKNLNLAFKIVFTEESCR
jgi:hypothetical protein